MQAVGAAVDHINKLDVLRPLQVHLGRTHLDIRGFDGQYFPAFEDVSKGSPSVYGGDQCVNHDYTQRHIKSDQSASDDFR